MQCQNKYHLLAIKFFDNPASEMNGDGSVYLATILKDANAYQLQEFNADKHLLQALGLAGHTFSWWDYDIVQTDLTDSQIESMNVPFINVDAIVENNQINCKE